MYVVNNIRGEMLTNKMNTFLLLLFLLGYLFINTPYILSVFSILFPILQIQGWPVSCISFFQIHVLHDRHDVTMGRGLERENRKMSERIQLIAPLCSCWFLSGIAVTCFFHGMLSFRVKPGHTVMYREINPFVEKVLKMWTSRGERKPP